MPTEQALQSELRDYERSMSRANKEIKMLKSMLDEAIEAIQMIAYEKEGGSCPAASGMYDCPETIGDCRKDSEECWKRYLEKQIGRL